MILTPDTLRDKTAYQQALHAGTAKSSQRAYTRDVRYFWAWAQLAVQQAPHYPITLETIIRFILDHAQGMDPDIELPLLAARLRTKPGPLRISTLRRYLASLSVAHA